MERRDKGGFSLVELAVVITIIALVLSLAASGLRAQLTATEVISTQEKIDGVKQALENFYDVHGRYPCPASPNLTPDNASFGVAPASCRTTCPAGQTCVANAVNTAWEDMAMGSIPHVTLEIPLELTIDAYGSKMSYALDPRISLIESNCQMFGALTVQDYNNNVITSDAFYVIVSHGEDGKGAFKPTSGSVTNACDAGAKDGENCDGDMIFRSAAINQSSTAANFHDDIIGFGLNRDAKYCPAGLTDCEVWIDAADRCSVIENTGGIHRVYDKSPNGYFAYQNTSTNRPEYTLATVNGKRTITFKGTNTDALYLGFSPALTRTPYTFVTVFTATLSTLRLTAITNSPTFSASSVDRSHYLTAGRVVSQVWPGSADTLLGVTSINDGRPHIAITTVGTISNHQLFIDGKLEISGTATQSNNFGDNTVILGSHQAPSDMNLLEYIYIGKELSTGERKALELYLANKWGINY